MEEAKIVERKPHENREDLAGEHVWGDAGQLILLTIFLAVWIGDVFFLKYSTFLAMYIPIFVKIPLAVIFFLSAGYLAKTGHIVFDEVREPPSVIKKGVFGRVRHPLYLGAIVFYFGLLALKFSLIATLIWIGIIAFYHFIARHEEKLLLKKFGQEYANYIREVPMWIPRIT